MSISTLAAYQSRRDNGQQKIRFTRNNVSILTPGRQMSQWTVAGDATGVAPTTAVVPTNATAGAFAHVNATGQTLRLLKATLSNALDGAGKPGMFMLIDRLSHQGGLSGTALGAQVTNLPTAALTRQTGGASACVEIYTAIGTSGATATVSYTSENGAGRTSPAFNWGVSGYSGVGHCSVIPLQVGDKFVKSVESFTASGSSGSVGNFGITIYNPLAVIPVGYGTATQWEALLDLSWFAQIVDNACLSAMLFSGYTATGVREGELVLAED